MNEEENSLYKVYISIFEEKEASATRFLKPVLLDDFLTDEDAMKFVISMAKETGVQPQTRDGYLWLGGQHIGKYWHKLVEKIYEE